MIAQNIAYAAVQAGHRMLFRTASEILTDLACDSPQLRRRKFNSYARPALLVIDEVGYTWNEVFPDATCIATLLERLTHYADITTIEVKSYRLRASEQAAARQNQRYVEQ